MNTKWTRNQKILIGGLIVSIGMLFVQVWSLAKKIQPVIEMKPQIVNVINNITKVEKEIANIREAIHQQYAAFKTEIFRKADLGNRITIYTFPGKPETSMVLFELEAIPVENSIQIGDNYGFSMAASTFFVKLNIIFLNVGEMKPADFLKNDKEVYNVKYIPDTTSNEVMRIIKGLKIDEKGIAFRPKSQNKPKELKQGTKEK
jgi:hypothetical protein